MKKKRIYTVFQLVSSVFMTLALLWLTVSAPIVYASQLELAKHSKVAGPSIFGGCEEEAANAFGNNTEEKTPGGSSSFSEEYIHDHHITEYFHSLALQYHKFENHGTYIAYHGELNVPPPELS